MRIKTILLGVVSLAISIWPSAHAGEEPKPANAEAKAKADYDAAEEADKEAEAALAPSRETMKKADIAYARARKAANVAREKAIEAKNLAGEPGVQDLKRAEANLSAAIKAVTDATNAKPPLEKALAEAKAATVPLRQAYNAAAKAAKEAEAAAKVAADAANKLDNDAKRATAQAAAKRRMADTAKAALDKARRSEQKLQNQANEAPKQLVEVESQKRAADEALAGAKNQVAAATAASATAEKAAREADAKAKQIAADAAKPDAERKQAADNAAAKRKAADAVKAALAKAQQDQRMAQAKATVAAKMLPRAIVQKKVVEAGLASIKKQVAAATTAFAKTDKMADAFEKVADAKRLAAAQATAKRRAAADPANRAAQEAAKELFQRDAAAQQTAAVAAAKHRVANEAKAALDPKQRTLDQAAVQAARAAQALIRAEARKKSAEDALINLKKQIAAAKESHVADERAAQKAERIAAPLQTEQEKTRAAWLAAREASYNKRELAERAKAKLHRLVAARQMAILMESSDPPKPANRIDEIVFAKLKGLGIEPILCSDAVFVRRAYLDVTGTLPSEEEAGAFIQSSDKNKRVVLIDRLLDRSAHVDYWSMKWSDILRVKAMFPVNVWPNAAQAYHRWVWESVARNKPYDQFARELLTSSGSNFRVGSVNFYLAVQDQTPEGMAAAVGLALMGTRVHLWPEDRRAGLAVFFSQVGYKPTSAWNEEIVFWDPLNSTAVPGSIAPGMDTVAKSVTATNQIPQALAEPLSESEQQAAVFPDGTKTTIPPNRDPREVFADWLIRPEKPWFSEAIANRTWAWVMGRGIIHEPDDIREGNPPSNPELLAYLEKELVSSGYDLKHLKRLIFTSTTYQFSSIPRFKGPEASANFATYPLRRLEAEVLIDSLNQITGSSDLYTSAISRPYSYFPEDMSAVALADGRVANSLLTVFGRSARVTGMENERVNELAPTQWLHTLNSAAIQRKLHNSRKLAELIGRGDEPKEITERLYLTILSRFPTDADVKAATEHVKTVSSRGRDDWVDLAWALINSPEFLLRH